MVDIFSFDLLFKIIAGILLIYYVFYCFMLILRVRILSDTVETQFNRVVKGLAVMHTLVVIVGVMAIFVLLAV